MSRLSVKSSALREKGGEEVRFYLTNYINALGMGSLLWIQPSVNALKNLKGEVLLQSRSAILQSNSFRPVRWVFWGFWGDFFGSQSSTLHTNVMN